MNCLYLKFKIVKFQWLPYKVQSRCSWSI